MNTSPLNPSLRDRQVGLVLFLAVFLFYFLLAPGFSVPGRWALVATSFSGLEPFRPVMRPVWSGLVALIAASPIANLGFALNILTSLIGAGVCWLVYEIVRRIPYARIIKRKDQDEIERIPRRLAGLTASLFAAVSIPVMITSTRGDYSGLDILLALTAIYPFMLYLRQPRPALVYASAVLTGVALAEYPGMIFIAPGLVMLWLHRFWRQGWPAPAVYVFALICLLAGLSSLLVYSALVLQLPVAAFREWATLGDVLKEFGWLYYGEFRYAVPKVGWLLILGMNILPLILVVAKELDEPSDTFTALGVYLFRVALVALGVITLFNLPGAPGSIVPGRVLLLAPGIVTGMWFGFLAGYHDGVWARGRRKSARAGLRLALAVMLIFAAARHADITDAGPAAPVAVFAADVVERLEDRSFVITDGAIDESLRLAARRAGRPLHCINVMHRNDPDRGRYYASLFEDPESEAQARPGVASLLRAWLASDPEIASKVVFLMPPDMAELSGLRTIPDGALYAVAAATDESVPLDDVEARNRTVWAQWPASLDPGEDREVAGWTARLFMMRWLSRVANDLGVYLDDAGEPARAKSAFRQAIAFWPDNISATLNLLERARREGDVEGETSLRATLQEQQERTKGQFPPHLLYRLCGRVRDAAALLDEAAMLGIAGQDEQAGERIRRATGLLTESVEVSPDNWLSLAMLARSRDDEELFRKAKETLDAAEDYLPGLILLGNDAMERGQLAEARRYLDRALKVKPSSVAALERLLVIHYYERDADALRKHSDALLAVAPDHPLGLYSAATVHIAAGRYDLAEAPLRRCLRKNDYGPAHNDLAWLLSERGDHAGALTHARRAVELLPDDKNAFDTLAMIHLRLGQTAEAVDAIDRALAMPGGTSASILLHAVEIYTAAGESGKAAPVLARLRNARDTLPEDLRKRLDALAPATGD